MTTFDGHDKELRPDALAVPAEVERVERVERVLRVETFDSCDGGSESLSEINLI